MGEPINRRVLDFVEALKREEAIYRELIHLSEEKRQTLTLFDAAALQGVIETEQETLNQLLACEEDRHRIQRSIEQEISLEDRPLDIKELSDYISTDLLQSLEESKESLRSLTSQLKMRNEENSELIHQSLNFIQFSLDAIAKVAGQGYTQQGKTRPPSLQGRLNHRG